MPSCWYWWMDSNHRLPAYQAGALYHWTTPVYIEGFAMQIVYPFEMVFLSWFDHKLHEPVITIILLHLGWRLGRGLNPQPPAWQAGALTNWATESLMAPMASKDGLYQYWRIGLWCPQTPMLSYADKLLEHFHLAVCLLFICWENFSRFPKRSRFLKLLRISISGHYTNTYNPSALCRLCPDIGKHLGGFVYTRCSNPRDGDEWGTWTPAPNNRRTG